MDHAIRGLIGHAFDRATEILNTHRAVYEKTAQCCCSRRRSRMTISRNVRTDRSRGRNEPTPEMPVAAIPRDPVALN
jgi:hypothetical protein